MGWGYQEVLLEGRDTWAEIEVGKGGVGWGMTFGGKKSMLLGSPLCINFCLVRVFRWICFFPR